MEAEEMNNTLIALLNAEIDVDEAEIEKAVDFSQAMMLASDNGLILKAFDGSEFQLTLVRSR